MTIADSVADEHVRRRTCKTLAMRFARILNAEARDLVEAGADVVQFDEPCFNIYLDEVAAWGIEALEQCHGRRDGAEGRAHLLRLRHAGRAGVEDAEHRLGPLRRHAAAAGAESSRGPGVGGDARRRAWTCPSWRRSAARTSWSVWWTSAPTTSRRRRPSRRASGGSCRTWTPPHLQPCTDCGLVPRSPGRRPGQDAGAGRGSSARAGRAARARRVLTAPLTSQRSCVC